MTTNRTFRANGKLMLSGEYTVLDGATALGLPVRYGQRLEVTTGSGKGLLHWQSFDKNGEIWLDTTFDPQDISPLTPITPAIERLQSLFREARNLNPDFLTDGTEPKACMYTDFGRHWGFGSSSTLVSLIAEWAAVDPFKLNAATFGGSGYDIACARAEAPIFYHLRNDNPTSIQADANFPFADRLYLVYTGRKQNSRQSIQHYKTLRQDKQRTAALRLTVSAYSEAFARCRDFTRFEQLIRAYEQQLATILKLKRAKERLFPDFTGEVKSLGGWGGDFVLLTNPLSEQALHEYLQAAGFSTVLKFRETVLL